MADRVLRDQCVHGRCDEHWWPDIFPVQVGHTYTGGAELCPGGREVTINYQAAVELARTFRNLEWNHRAVRTVVDAALPDLEV